MTPLLISEWGSGTKLASYGISWRVVSTGAATFQTEIQRTSEGGGATPATSAWLTVRTLAVGELTFNDSRLQPSTSPFYYRARHVLDGWDEGDWSAAVSALNTLAPGDRRIRTVRPSGEGGGLKIQAGDLDDVDDGTNYVKYDTNYADTNRPHRGYSTQGVHINWSNIYSTVSTAAAHVKPTVGIQDSTDNTYIPVRHTELGSGLDSSAQAFTADFVSIPSIVFFPQVGISYSTEHTATQFQNMKAVSASVSGFTLRAEVQEGDSITAIKDGFSGIPLTQDSSFRNDTTTDANTNECNYVVWYDITTTGMDVSNVVLVEVLHDNSGSFVTQASRYHTYGQSTTFSPHALNFSDSLDSTTQIQVKITYGNPPGSNTASCTPRTSSVTPAGIEYNRVDSGGAAVAMASTPGEAVAWIATEKGN